MSRDNQCITITSSLPSGGDVGGVWAAMELAGSLQKHMQSVAGRCSDIAEDTSDSQGSDQPALRVLQLCTWMLQGT